MKKVFIALCLLSGFYNRLFGKDIIVTSPDKNIKVTVVTGRDLTYSISFGGKKYLDRSAVSMTLSNGKVLGVNPVIANIKSQTVSRMIKPLYGITNVISENFNETAINIKGSYSVVFRVYNEGVAYRFVTNFQQDFNVVSELSNFQFTENHRAYFHPILSESNYRIQKISDPSPKPNYTSLPLLVKTNDGTNILIHESDVLNYPCMSLSVDTAHVNRLIANHARYPKRVQPGGYMNFNLDVKETEDYIAKTKGARDFPWRIIAFEKNDKDILSNQLVYLLASESKLKDVSWIKPGRVSWDWWNAMNLTGVPFKTGVNTATYKYFIDFAAANGIEYVNLDEDWSDPFDLMKVNKNLDVEQVINYAKSKKVGIILWCMWQTLDKQMVQAMDLFQKWGVAGLKVDFMDRDDQVVVEFHERILREAAARKMLVNYHGAYHPTGMARTYPNNINVEGVRGLEWNKFDPDGASPDHAVSIPFIRMFAGSMDYTPGAMTNFNKKEWKQITDRPMSQGTRCQQLAMFVVYYAPLQMLSDAPTAYEKEPDYLNFISQIPVVWDEVRPLESAVGKFVAVARRKGSSWFLGAMTNWDARKLEIPLDFLEKGKTYEAEIFADGANAHRVGSDYVRLRKEVKFGDVLPIELSAGGGFAARFSLKK